LKALDVQDAGLARRSITVAWQNPPLIEIGTAILGNAEPLGRRRSIERRRPVPTTVAHPLQVRDRATAKCRNP
jgi:hypothetical protein